MSRVLLAVNTLTAVGSQPYASHLSLCYRIGKDEQDEFLLFNGNRVSIDRFRNQAGRYAIDCQCDFLMFLDDDVLIPPTTYSILKRHDKDVVTPHVFIRGYPYEPMFFVSRGVERNLADGTGVCNLGFYTEWEEVVEKQQNPLLECSAIGFSCCLIKTEVLKKVSEPWFITGLGHTEDVYFCIKAREELKNEIGIFVDTSLHAGHMLDPEFICYENRSALRKFNEELNPLLMEKKDATGRSDSTVEGKSENCGVECAER